jgi:hypothetical protein
MGGKYVNIAQNAPTTIRVLISLLLFIRHSLSKAERFSWPTLEADRE